MKLIKLFGIHWRLRPCPRCGSRNLEVFTTGPCDMPGDAGKWVSCCQCDRTGGKRPTTKLAVAAWNGKESEETAQMYETTEQNIDRRLQAIEDFIARFTVSSIVGITSNQRSET